MTPEQKAGRRGAPLMFLVAVIGGWLVARAATFTPLWEDAGALDPTAPPASQDAAAPAPADAVPTFARLSIEAAKSNTPRGGRIALVRRGRTLPPVAGPLSVVADSLAAPASDSPNIASAGSARQSGGAMPPSPVSHSAGPVESGLMLSPPQMQSPRRWSADGWLLLREDTGRPVVAGRPSYGRSQAGAVLRYSLAPSSAHLPQAHLRATAALAGTREREVAAGLSARLGRKVPLRVAVEARVSELGAETEVRAAAYAVTELPPIELPLGVRGEAYLQGGYVDGRFATAFVDGQARVERPVARFEGAELSVGAGTWGGAQKGSERLDVGPTAAASFRFGAMRGRIAADYRFRVAGQAEPSSGPALTVSAGF